MHSIQKGAMESELAALKAGGAVTAAVAPSAPAAKDRAAPADDEIKKLNDELERVSMQLVTASLGHAQAEQDRLEAKQQVRLEHNYVCVCVRERERGNIDHATCLHSSS